MIFVKKLTEIITNPATGRISMTKLAAATGHLNAASWFAWLTYKHGFIAELWIIYLGATIVHNGYDKAVAAMRDKTSTPKSVEPQQP
ncbi:hypothetical protein Dolphis_38 [Pseudomonas phage Dolphis]|nr:hypothetical protein Dolphis_38 [Pseudomonas phage Dolphis]